MVSHKDWGMNVHADVSTHHEINRFGIFALEKGTSLENMVEPMEALGYKVKLRALNSGLHAIAITKDGLAGGADPRREGIAWGQ